MDLSYNGNGFQPKTCQRNAKAAIWVSIADKRFAVPRSEFSKALVVKINVTSHPSKKNSLYSPLITKKTGCPGSPIKSAFMVLKGKSVSAPRPILVSWARPINRQILRQKMLSNMRKSANCRVNGELLICVGKETVKGRRTAVTYIVAAKGPVQLRSGAPFYIRCLGKTCELRDEFSPNVRVSTFPVFAKGSIKISSLKNQIEAASMFVRKTSR